MSKCIVLIHKNSKLHICNHRGMSGFTILNPQNACNPASFFRRKRSMKWFYCFKSRNISSSSCIINLLILNAVIRIAIFIYRRKYYDRSKRLNASSILFGTCHYWMKFMWDLLNHVSHLYYLLKSIGQRVCYCHFPI